MREFNALYCDRCMCRASDFQKCRLAFDAEMWIRKHYDSIEKNKRFFEDVVEEYPGPWRSFMMTWCEEFGGI